MSRIGRALALAGRAIAPVGRALRRAGRSLAPRAHLVFPLVASLTIVVGTWPIWPGAVLSGDATFHLGNAQDVADLVADGQDPLGRLPQMIGTPTFRFYQALHALLTGTTHALTGIDLELLFTIFTVVPFLLSPFAYTYMVRSLGFGRWIAGLAGFVAITTVLGFSNSFLGLICGGIVTQAPAALFCPLFVGKFVRVLRGEKGVAAAAVFFALTAVSHAAFAVFAVVAAGLATVVILPKSPSSLARAVGVGALGVVLAAFWVVPFLAYHDEHRPVSDAVARSDRRMWFSGITGTELGALVATGRFFDGERDEDRDKGTDEYLDTKMRNLNIFGLHTYRPPVLTWVLALALVVAVVRIRDPGVRFLLCLAITGLLLVLGLDDVRWMGRLPFMGRMQGFRATYLIDLGALAIAAFGLHEVARLLVWLGRKLPRFGRIAAATLGIVVVVAGTGVACGWMLVHAWRFANPGLGPWEITFRQNLDRHRRRMGPYRLRGYFKNAGRDNRRNNELHVIGYRVPCAHVTGLVGQTAQAVCGSLHQPGRSWKLAELVGVGFFIVDNRLPHGLDAVRGKGGAARYRRLTDRRTHQLWESLERSYAHVAAGPLVLVRSDPSQWVLLLEKWIPRYTSRIDDPSTPVPVRVSDDDLADETLLAKAAAVAVLDPDDLDPAPAALRKFANDGGRVHSIAPIRGLSARILAPSDSWSVPFEGLDPPPRRPDGERFELLQWGVSGREFHLRVTLRREGLVHLAEGAFANWKATVDGRPVPVRPGGPDLASVFVPRGTHRLDFEWVKTPVEVASYTASGLGWAGVLAVAILGVRRRWRLRRARRDRPPGA